MKHTWYGFPIFLAIFCSSLIGQRYEKTSPFDMIRWNGERPEVRLGERWYEAKKIGGTRVQSILRHAKKKHGWKWDARFCEDLPQLLAEMGKKPGSTIALQVKDLATGKTTTKKAVAMSREKRNRIRAAEPRVRGTDKPPRQTVPSGIRHDKLSPFKAVRFRDDEVEVKLANRWFLLNAINDTKTEEIIRHCQTAHSRRWQKRFSEDLVQILAEMNVKHDSSVNLDVVDLKVNLRVVLDDVAMTPENRRAIWRANNEASRTKSGARKAKDSRPKTRRTKRPHQPSKSQFAKKIVRRYATNVPSPTLTGDQVAEDLDQLEYLLDHEFSYAKMKRLDYHPLLDAIRFAAKDGIALSDFHIQLRKLIALFGDGHARARGVFGMLPRGCPPFGFAEVKGRIIAFDEEGNLFNKKFPYVKSMGGIPIGSWIEAAGETSAQGSPQFIRSEALRYLSFLDYVGQTLGRKASPRIDVTFTNKGGKAKRVNIALSNKVVFPGLHLPSENKILEQNIGYIRLEKMRSNGDFLDSLDRAMADSKNTKGLIIDVRDNGGGSRMALRRLLPYFMAKEDAPRVCNVARYRLPEHTKPGHPEGYLQNRLLLPLPSKEWNKRQQKAIRRFTKSFRASWKVNDHDFSDWHYMLLDATSNKKAYHYTKRVIILINENCFSATDIFVGAFKGLKGVTLVGTATGGGSGRSQQTRLKWSRIRVKLSSMASFQPNGQLYDGVGITPDIVKKVTLDDWLGKSDSQLDMAKKIIGKR